MDDGHLVFESWWTALRGEAHRREADWVIGSDPEFYRQSFEAGRSPAEEVDELLRISEWRGCGCGGG